MDEPNGVRTRMRIEISAGDVVVAVIDDDFPLWNHLLAHAVKRDMEAKMQALLLAKSILPPAETA